MKRQASLNYLNKQIWNLKSGSENGTLHRRIVVSSDQPIMDWAKTSLMLRDEKSLYALSIIVVATKALSSWRPSGIIVVATKALSSWRPSGIIVVATKASSSWRRKRRRTVDQASSKMAASTGVVERGVVNKRRRKWRRQSGAERGVVNSGVESGVVEVAPKVASSTVASSKGVVDRRRRKASSTSGIVDSGVVERRRRKASSTGVVDSGIKNGVKWHRMASNEVERRRMASNDVKWHRMTSNAIECHRMLVECSSNTRRMLVEKGKTRPNGTSSQKTFL